MGRDLSRWITEQNIIRFRQKLEAEKDPVKRKALEALVAQEEKKLRERPAD